MFNFHQNHWVYGNLYLLVITRLHVRGWSCHYGLLYAMPDLHKSWRPRKDQMDFTSKSRLTSPPYVEQELTGSWWCEGGGASFCGLCYKGMRFSESHTLKTWINGMCPRYKDWIDFYTISKMLIYITFYINTYRQCQNIIRYKVYTLILFSIFSGFE